ncbi:MAG: hypothetical protein ACREJX_01890, partial [Polyangiaceae bacterium]
GVAVAQERVYWVERNAADASLTAKSISVEGGTPDSITLPDGMPLGAGASSTSASNDAVYVGLEFGNQILRLPLDGSPATLIAAKSPTAMAFDDANIYFGSQGAVSTVPKAGGDVVAIAPAENPTGVAVDDAFIYFADDTSTGRIVKVAKSGGTPIVLADNQGAPHAIAVDANYVYWNCINEGTIKKIAK